MDADFLQIFDFILTTDRLKSVLRRSRPLGTERRENAAEHSWQVALLAMLMARQSPQPIDAFRAVQILLVHDIPEIDIGDTIVYQSKDATAAAAERMAAERLFGLLPQAERDWCLYAWDEYEQRETAEAKFAYAVDRMMPVLQNINTRGQTWAENQVPLHRILEVNAAIGDALPEVWANLRPRIEVVHAEMLAANPPA